MMPEFILADQDLALAFMAIGILISILWLVIGWRAMKAHEKLAVQAERANDRLEEQDSGNVRELMKSQSRLYRMFVRKHPEVEMLSSKERHERFREWELEQKQGEDS